MKVNDDMTVAEIHAAIDQAESEIPALADIPTSTLNKPELIEEVNKVLEAYMADQATLPDDEVLEADEIGAESFYIEDEDGEKKVEISEDGSATFKGNVTIDDDAVQPEGEGVAAEDVYLEDEDEPQAADDEVTDPSAGSDDEVPKPYKRPQAQYNPSRRAGSD